MTDSTHTLHINLIRAVKAMIVAWEKWLTENSRATIT